jgi:hypothetical protein
MATRKNNFHEKVGKQLRRSVARCANEMPFSCRRPQMSHKVSHVILAKHEVDCAASRLHVSRHRAVKYFVELSRGCNNSGIDV